MTTVRKYLLAIVFALLFVCCFVFVGCDQVNISGGGDKVTVRIEGAYDFTFDCELKEKKALSTPQEVADTVNRISNGAVESADVAGTAVDGAIYTILIKGIPEETNLKEFFRTVEEDYLKLYSAWKNFPDAPVKYTTNNGKDVLVYVSTEKAEDNEIMIYVFFFEEGAVDELADAMGGGHGGNGEKTTVQIEYAYDFVYYCELTEKHPYGYDRQEMADTVSALTDGRVSASDLLYRVAPESSTLYRIFIKDAAEKDNVEEHLRLIGEQYLAKFTSWQGFSEVPVKYTMENGKELAVYVSTENAAENELKIYVFFFEEGTMAILSGNSGDDHGGGTHGGEGGGQGETNTIEINGAYDFTGNCELIGSRLFMNNKEAAMMLSEISGGRVKSDAVIGSVVDGGGEYKIRINGIPEGAKLQEYIKRVANEYLSKYSAWKTFPDSPVKYTTNNGVDVLIYVSADYYYDRQIYICVFLFNAGSVDALAESMSGGQGGSGGEGGSHGGEGGGETQEQIQVPIYYSDGRIFSATFNVGEEVNFYELYSDTEFSLYADFYPVLGTDELVTVTAGLVVYARPKQQTPSEVSVTIYDIDTDGNKTIYMTEHPRYNSTFKFVYYGFVLYWDEEFTQEIDPNQEFTLTKDVEVYRRDYYDRVPVFFNVHYYTNGVEENIGAQDVFFRGELLSIDKNFISRDFGYEFYYDMGKTQKVFEGDGVIVVRETDDKKNVYGFRDDRRQAVLTFMLGGNELCKELIGVDNTIGDYYYLYLGTKTYWIKDCNPAKDQKIRGNTTINITDCEVTNNYAVTVHLCYKGDVKRTFVNYFPIGGEDWEITADDGYYTDASCTQPFVGTVNSTTTLYQKIGVNFDRYVGN